MIADPSALPLESRDCPAAFDAGGGIVHVRTGWEVPAFPGWAGELRVLDAGPAVWVGAGFGGGPRVAAFDTATGGRLTDYFAGDPATRAGAVLVGVPEAVGADGVPSLSYGAGYPLYLDFERPPSVAWVRDVAAGVADLFHGADVRVTTDRPDSPPAGYGTVVVGAPVGHAGAGVVGVGEVGAFAAGRPVLVQGGLGPALTAVVAAHEAGHGFGLGHVTDPRDVMFPAAEPGQVFSAAELAAFGG